MQALDKVYQDQLDALKEEVINSEELAAYLESEEDDDYNQLKEQHEPKIAMLYDKVAEHHPLQLVDFERQMLDPGFEGLYLPKILGFSVLRGEGNDREKYTLPQEHFKAVLMAICNSANFDILKKRIGQTIQMGFAYSSDIWVTNLITPITNKQVRRYLQQQRLDRYRVPDERKRGIFRYKKQFKNENFQTADFPKTMGRLKTHFSMMKNFLIYRIHNRFPNDSIIPHIIDFVNHEEFHGTREHTQIMALFAMFFDLDKERTAAFQKTLNDIRKATPDFDEMWLDFVLELHLNTDVSLLPEADLRASALLDRSVEDQLSEYYTLLDTIHGQGYLEDEAHEATRDFYNKHEGLSTVNECVRQTIYRYFARFFASLTTDDYTRFFDITKTFSVYMGIFLNQQFNQDIKTLSMTYVKKLLKRYTDKRGKDYQDVKKFVTTVFQDLNFLKEKEVVELFKTRRKRKPKAS